MSRFGVCSWSLQAGGPAELVAAVRACGLDTVQLALEPLRSGRWPESRTRDALAEAGIAILSGMMSMRGEDYSTLESIRRTGGIVPDEHWPANLAAAAECAQLAHRLGIQLVTFHAGFIPHDAGDPGRAKVMDRLQRIADVFQDAGVAVGLETGQERAETLLELLEDLGRPSVGVNFDPANMILYGMGDPVAAFRRLRPHIVQMHIKDAVAAGPGRAGEWGMEVAVGQGEVDWMGLFAELAKLPRPVDLVIERESGGRRVGDVVAARELLERHV